MVLKISLPSGRHREGSKINHFDKFLFSPSKGSHRETPKIAGWMIFFCPSRGRARKSDFMRILKNYSQSFLPSQYSIGKFPSENKKLFCFQTPSLIPTRVGVCAPFFQNIFFAQNTKTAEKPDKQGVFSGKNFFEIFLIWLQKGIKSDIITEKVNLRYDRW